MKKAMPWVAFGLLILAGLGLLLYPVISDYVNQRNGSHAIQVLADTVSRTDERELEWQRSQAEAYNRSLQSPKQAASGDYRSILDFGNGIMGSLEIPKIDVNLPIHHGTEEEVLARGLGHMPQSAFPIGGKGNHAAIVGHTGLPSAKMLDDLVKLEVGDGFFVNILGDTLHYCVDQILVVEPSDSQALTPEPGEDYCTLVTCTPYGVNSHRLLVRGRRTEEAVQPLVQPLQDPVPMEELWWTVLIFALLLGALVATALLLRIRK